MKMSSKRWVRKESDLVLMRESGRISAVALKKVLEAIKPGVNLLELEKVAEEAIKSEGGAISFKTEPGYFWATCLTVNDEVVHGIPRDIVLKKGDKLSVDLGALYKGWHTDTAWSVIVGDKPTKFLNVGEEALWKAIKQAKAGNRVGDISNAIQTTIEGAGYSVVKTLVGHGVGRSLHEDPLIPGIGKPKTGPILASGMTVAIEAIYAEKDGKVEHLDDGWTISTKDGSLGGLFEMTVIIKEGEPEVITDWRKV